MSRRASGLRAWIFQRLSAMYLAIAFIYMIGWFLISPPANHAEWLAWVSNPLNGVGLLLLIAALLLHAWVGFRDILIDYIPIFSLRLAALSALGIGLATSGLWAMRIVLAPLIV